MKRNVHQGVLAAVIAAVTTVFVMIVGQPAYVPASQGPAFMPTTGTYNGLQAANTLNGALDALLTCNKGSTAPTNALGGIAKAGQCWIDDTSATLLIKKRYTGSAWVVEGVLDVTNGVWAPPVGGGSATVNSATSTDLCASPVALQTVNGTTTIAGFGSNCANGVKKVLVFQGAVTLTYNATQLIIPGQRDYLTSAGDVAEAVYLGSGNWRVTSISKIDGNAVLSPSFRVGTIYTTFEDIDSKAVLAYGQALTRASYPDYLTAVTRTQSGTRASGNATLTSVANTAGLGAGMPIEGAGIPAGTTISSVTSSTIVMSANASSSGTANVVIFKTGYGSGGDSTTVGVPDCRGNKIAGRDNMGGIITGRINNGTVLNALQGGSTSTLIASNLPPVVPTGSASSSTSVSLTAPGALSSGTITKINIGLAGGGNVNDWMVSNGSALANASATAATSTTITMNALPGASSAPVAIVDPTIIADCAMRVLP